MKTYAAGVNTYGYIWQENIQQCLAQLATHGFRVFEGVINPPHMDIESTPGKRRALRDFMEGEGLSFSSLNLPSLDSNLVSPFAYTRDYTVSLFKKAIGLAADLRAPQLVTVPGRLNPLLPPSRAARDAWLQDTLGQLIPYAREHGVGLALENVPFASLPHAQDLADFVEAMGNQDVLGVCYDVANAHFVGESLSEGLRCLDGHVRLVHCSDTTRSAWRHDVVGKGDVPWAELAQALQASSYDGPVLLEIVDPDPKAATVSSRDSLVAQGIFHNR